MMAAEDEQLTGADAAEGSTNQGKVQENTSVLAARTLAGQYGIIDDICALYVLEYLSSTYNLGAEQWAEQLNLALDEVRDKPGFEFLTQEVDGEKVPRRVDPEKYDQFLASKTELFKNDTRDLREQFLTNQVSKDQLIAIVEDPNSVFLSSIFDNDRDLEEGVADVTVEGFVEPFFPNFPADADLQLNGANFWLFYLFTLETGLISKDYRTDSPADIEGLYAFLEGFGRNLGKTVPDFSSEKITLDYREGVFRSQDDPKRLQNLTWMPIYKPVKRTTSIRGTEVPTNKFAFLLAEGENDETGDFYNDLDFAYPFELDEIVSKKNLIDKYGTRGTPNLIDGATLKTVPDFALFYPIGKSGIVVDNKAQKSQYFNPIYEHCLKVVAAIASLYSVRTAKSFESVLKALVDVSESDPSRDFFAEESEDRRRRPEIAAPKALRAADHQCYLLENVRAISGAKEKLIKDAGQTYTNLGAINTTYSPGNIISVINHGGTDTTEEKDALINLCPEIYALLTPFIEVYRVEYKRDDEKKLRPVRHARIPFPNFIHPDDIDAITSREYGRFAGAGIKSFTWSLDGVQPAEVDNNISAKLELHFQTIQDLFSLNEAQGAGAAQPGYLDLIIASPGVKESNNNNDETEEAPEAEKRLPPISTACFEAQMLSYDPRDFEIKVCAGWSLPPNFANIVNELEFARNHPPDYGEKLALAIQKSTTTLYLTLTDHELNFNENGSVDLNVFYQARLSGLTRSPAADIFASPSLFEDDIKDADKQIKELNKKKEKYLSDTNTTDINDETLDGINKQLEEALEKKARIVKQDKAIKYRKFLDRLYCSNKIYSYKANQRKLLRDIDSPRLRAAKARGLANTEEYTNGYNPQQTDGAADKLYADAARTIGEISGVRENGTSAARRFIGAVKALDEARKAANGDLEIPFFYLGDLIDEVVGHVGNLVNKNKGSLQILLSEVELLDPLQMYQIEQVKIPCPNDKSKEIVRAITDIDPMRYKDLSGISFTINIGSIPISLEFFQEWFINNVVKGQASKYNLLRFIKTVCSSLISKAFNSICFEGGPQFSLRFDTATFNFDRSFAGEIVNVDTLAKSKTRAQMNDCGELIANKPQTVPAFVVSSMDSKPLTGDYIHDLRRGIYHYYLGASCGIAKSIKFNRTGIPYYREARLQRTSALSALQLREMYNVNIEMVGNTIHRNGQYIYVNPVAIGAGSLKTKGTLPNLARLLGIGGYYLVTGVSHNVSAAGFNVSLTGIQEGIDFSEAGTPIQLVPYDPPDGIVTIGEMTAEPLPGQSIPAGPD